MDRLKNVSRLTLGTAQIGMRYGVVNSVGEPDEVAVREILDHAWAAGIDCFDTAQAYGTSEQRIGTWLRKAGANPIIMSKLPAVPPNSSTEEVIGHFDASAKALQVDRIDAYLCHRAKDLDHPGVLAALRQLRSEERISHFGVSVYTTEELEKAMTVDGVSIVQVPASLANQSFVTGGAIESAAEVGIHMFVRSVYLQGILLCEPDRLPKHLAPLARPLSNLHSLAREAGHSVQALAHAAATSLAGVRSTIVGADSRQQLHETLNAASAPTPEDALIETAKSIFRDVPSKLTDPSRWSTP